LTLARVGSQSSPLTGDEFCGTEINELDDTIVIEEDV
jgi:hypothetical protein